MPTDDQFHPIKAGLQIYPAKAVFFWLFRFQQLERGIPTKTVWENTVITYRTLCVCTNHCRVFANCLKTGLLINIILKKWFLYLILSLPISVFLCFTSCLSVHSAGVCGAFGADGMRGERNSKPLQTNTDTRRCVRGAFSLRGVAHSSWSRHQQTGQSSTPG